MACKPVMINRGQNHVTLSWENVDELKGECVLEMVDDLKKWIVVYRGEKKEVKVTGLAPCTCYDFRVKTLEGNWVNFKGATNEGPFFTMHLSRAVKVGKMALVRKIIHARPLLLEVENKEMKTPLRQAVEKNDVQMVGLLITLGANVNTSSYYKKMSLLMSAVAYGHLAVANFLVEKGCNVNSTDINGLNILHYAVDSNNIENVEFALKHSACVDSKDSNGWTPLLRADTYRSDDSLLSRCNLGTQVRGLPDVLVTTNALTRSLRHVKQQSSEEMCLQFDAVDYICRICHGGNSSGDLLTPCRCKGTIALAHLNCLEIWLNESNRNECELCQYHFRIIREPK